MWSSSSKDVSLEYPESDEKKDRPERVLVQNSSHVDDDTQIFALDAFCEIDGRKGRYIRAVLDRCREEDARDFRSRGEKDGKMRKVTRIS